jgi:hypothetical protein
MSILNEVEASLKDFRPKTPRQFVILNIATRFNDLANLARYLNACEHHSRAELLEAARRAEQSSFEDGRSPVEPFFARLADRDREEAA